MKELESRRKGIGCIKCMVFLMLMFVCGIASPIEASAMEYTDTPEPSDGNGCMAEQPRLDQRELYLPAQGQPEALHILNGMGLYWYTENASVAAVSPEGMVTPVNEGVTVINAVVTGADYQTCTLACTVYVLRTSLSCNELNIDLNRECQKVVSINGIQGNMLSMDRLVTYQIEDETTARAELWFDGIHVYGLKGGETRLFVTVLGETYTCTIKISQIGISQSSVVLSKGKTKTLKVAGTAGKVTWSAGNSRIATVSSKGVVKARASGNTYIKARVDGMELKCIVSVANDKAVKAVNKAKSVLGSAYSQARRMEKGFYDCSSLVWRSYSPYSVTLGNKNWAPTAADQAKWCMDNKRVIAEGPLEAEGLKLLPGDLIFYTRGVNNGRYKNIYHVAMFAGYDLSVGLYSADADGGIRGILVEADGRAVSQSGYRSGCLGGKEIVMIARPVK